MRSHKTYRRWHDGQESKPCVNCDVYFEPGHAVELTRDGTAHVDCSDPWKGYLGADD